MRYIRQAIGNLANQTMVPVEGNNLQDFLLKLVKENKNKEHYYSVYNYSEDDFKQYQTKGNAKGMSGKTTNRLFFDFDCSDNLNLTLILTRKLWAKLNTLGFQENEIQIYFSGGKGFHLEIALSDSLTKTELKNIVRAITVEYRKEFKDKYPNIIDWKLFDEQRLFRSPLSKNIKGFKTPLLREELFDLEIKQIIELAQSVDYDHYQNLLSYWNLEVKLPKEVEILKNSSEEETKATVIPNTFSLDDKRRPDFSSIPQYFTPAKWALHCGFFEPGERNEAYLILAATYKYLKKDEKDAYYTLKAVDERHLEICAARGLPRDRKSKDELWNQIIRVVYSHEWQGGTFSEKNNELLQRTKERYSISSEVSNYNVIEMSDLGGNSFKNYANSFFNTRIYTGLADLDKAFPMCAGSNIAIVGAASSGKTALSLNILKKMKESGGVSVFASLDMAKSRLYEKLLYNVTEGKITREELYQAYLDDQGHKFDELVKSAFPDVYIFSKSAPSVQQLRDYILKVQDHTGKAVRLLMVDYFERLTSEKSEDTAASKDVAAGIQDLIADFPDLTPITLFQPNKFSLNGGPDMPILNYTAIKGSSFVYQSARQILSIWRPFFSPQFTEFDNFMEMAILKNDLGELGMFKYDWVGKTGTISMMTDEAKKAYAEAMAMKDFNKRNKEDDDVFPSF